MLRLTIMNFSNNNHAAELSRWQAFERELK